MTPRTHLDRRRVLRVGARLATAGAAPWLLVARARAAGGTERSLAMSHTHTGEQLQLVYAVQDRYLPAALGSLDRFLRDHYSGRVGRIDPALFDLLHTLASTLGRGVPAYHVISGYRCPETNDRLRRTRGGGVAGRSLHMDGRAIDIRLPGVPLAEVRDAALELKLGGVGYYPGQDFVHVDTGRVRRW